VALGMIERLGDSKVHGQSLVSALQAGIHCVRIHAGSEFLHLLAIN
jgi:hypothetical protein